MTKRPATQKRFKTSKEGTVKQNETEKMSSKNMQDPESDVSDILGRIEMLGRHQASTSSQNQNISNRSTTVTSTANKSRGSSGQNQSVAGSSRRKQNKPKRKTNNVFREIRKLQKSVDFLIPKLPFARVVKEICADLGYDGIRFTELSLEALQEASETYLLFLLQDSYVCTLHRNRKTLSVIDIRLVRYLRGPTDPGNI